MTCRVFLEQTAADHYKATPLAFSDCMAVRKTRDEALSNLTAMVNARLSQGEMVTVEIDAREHPWLKGAGMFKDDPSYEDFLAEIEGHRRQVDQAELDSANVSP